LLISSDFSRMLAEAVQPSARLVQQWSRCHYSVRDGWPQRDNRPLRSIILKVVGPSFPAPRVVAWSGWVSLSFWSR
jgi:hypothetical protein